MEPEAIQGLDLLEGARAFEEARELESSFKRAMLPAEIARAFSGAHSTRPPGKRLPLHSYFVLLFASAFPEVPREQVVKLCRLDRLYTEHLPVFDGIIERRGGCGPLQLFLAHLKQFHGLRGLHGMFPTGHVFWSTFQGCYMHTWKAVLHERLHHYCRVHPYPLSEFEYVAAGKVALYKVFSLALAHLSERVGAAEILSGSLDQYHLGIYFLDDLQDWREDYVSNHFSFPLTRLILENDLEKAVASGEKPPLWKIGMLFYETGIAGDQIRQAEQCFRRAMDLVKKDHLPNWAYVLRRCIRRCEVMAGQLRQVCKRGIRAAARPAILDSRDDPEALGPNDAVAWAAATDPASTIAPEVLLQPGVPEETLAACRSVLMRCGEMLPALEPLSFHVGKWPLMPARFRLARAESLSVGINLDALGGMSGRLYAELAQAYAEAVRFQAKGRMACFAEGLFVRGVGLRLCGRLWPDTPPWEHAGMNPREWKWCEKNEWLLWEAARQQTDRKIAAGERDSADFGRPLNPIPHAPENAWSYVALRMVERIEKHKLEPDPAAQLTKAGADEIERDMDRYCN